MLFMFKSRGVVQQPLGRTLASPCQNRDLLCGDSGGCSPAIKPQSLRVGHVVLYLNLQSPQDPDPDPPCLSVSGCGLRTAGKSS